MYRSTHIASGLAALAIAGLALAPTPAFADRDGHGKKHHSAPPKKNGRHDNRNWNKERDDDRSRTSGFTTRLPAGSPWELQRASDRRQQMKNEWRNIAYASGAVALIGALQHDRRLVFAGTAGALYSLYRYEQDRKSQSQLDRLRAQYFGRSSFTRDGHTYQRRIVIRNGHKYYQFVRR